MVKNLVKEPFKVYTIEVRGQRIQADETVLEVLGIRYPSEIYTRQSLRTLKTHFKNFIIVDYDLKSITLGFEFEPSSLISMINWQVGTFVERKYENILTLRFNSLSNLRDAYYVIEETFSKLEEYLLIALVKGNFFFFGNSIVKIEKGKISFLRNPLYKVLSYITFKKRENYNELSSPIIRAMDIMSPERFSRQHRFFEKNVFYGILLMKVYANRAILGHHISTEMLVTFRNVTSEKLKKVLKIFEHYKTRFDGISEENSYYVFSDIIKDLKGVLYPKREIERLIEEAREIIKILREKSGRA